MLGYREFTQEVLAVIQEIHMIRWIGAGDMEPESGYSLKILKGSHKILIILSNSCKDVATSDCN